MKFTIEKLCLAIILAWALPNRASAQTFDTLYTIPGPAGPAAYNIGGIQPEGALVYSGGVAYGTAYRDGSSGYGTVFRVNANGTGFKAIHNFAGVHDGGNPQGPLVLSGNTLYGTTVGFSSASGASGAIFKVNTDGSGFTVLYSFSVPGADYAINAYTNSDGYNPVGGLVLSGNTLYGVTESGGTNGSGDIFQVNTDGTGFTTLYAFPALLEIAHTGVYTNSGGAEPTAGLALSGGALYGVTPIGGTNGQGTVFSISTNGNGFVTLHTGGYGAGLIQSGGMLYGTGQSGGQNSLGAIFALGTNGSGFTNLYSFSTSNLTVYGTTSVANDDGAFPMGALFLSGNTLYGATTSGGSNAQGTVFSLTTSGSAFSNLYTFEAADNGTNTSGARPSGLVLAGNMLLGTAAQGGVYDYGYGTVFGVDAGGSGLAWADQFSTNMNKVTGRPANLILSGSTLYGATGDALLAWNTDGSGYSNVLNFATGSDISSESAPYLVLSGTTFFGTAAAGGSNFMGEVFKVNTDGTGFQDLYSFTGNNDGGMPTAGLTLSGNRLYGTTSFGGSNFGSGTVFGIRTDGSGFTNLHSFTGGNDGGGPGSTLLLTGNTLYGTAGGGSNFSGTIFGIYTDGSGFTNLYAFTGGNDGAVPFIGQTGDLVLSGNTLYGAAAGGSNFSGTIFGINTDGTGFTNLYAFTGGSDGNSPTSELLLMSNTLYGTTSSGGLSNNGVVFSINTGGGGFTNYSFGGLTDNGDPLGELVISGQTFYGATQGNLAGEYLGSAYIGGTIFSLSFGPIIVRAPASIVNFSLAGSNAVINAGNGQANVTYVTLASTDITLPLNQWLPVATNVPSASGNFVINLTNALGTNWPRRFFSVELQ